MGGGEGSLTSLTSLTSHGQAAYLFLGGMRSICGGILADEPGLSKTLQLIVVLEALLSAGLVCSVLIVTPSNVL